MAGEGSIQTNCKEVRLTASERWQDFRIETTLFLGISSWRDVLFAAGIVECLTTDRKRANGPVKEWE